MEWYTNGNKRKEGKYRNGKKEEMWKMWYPNEQPSSEISYRDGKKYKWNRVWGFPRIEVILKCQEASNVIHVGLN